MAGGCMRIKLNVFNIREFLGIINECRGDIDLLYGDGRRETLNREIRSQSELLKRHRENKNCLRISLEIPDQKDYMRMVFFTIKDY